MTTLTANYAAKNAGAATGSKIGSFLRSLFVHFVQAHQAQALLLTADQHVADVAELNRMASKFEASQPNLAAELRFIASRG